MSWSWIEYLILGKISIYFLQIAPWMHIKSLEKYLGIETFIGRLVSCDLCLGTWVYAFFSLVLKTFGTSIENRFLNALMTGAVTSLVVHLISLGWKEKFGIVRFD